MQLFIEHLKVNLQQYLQDIFYINLFFLLLLNFHNYLLAYLQTKMSFSAMSQLKFKSHEDKFIIIFMLNNFIKFLFCIVSFNKQIYYLKELQTLTFYITIKNLNTQNRQRDEYLRQCEIIQCYPFVVHFNSLFISLKFLMQCKAVNTCFFTCI